MWKYLARNLKADVNMFSPIKLVSLRNRKPYRDLSNQNGMDFVTEISFCKTPVVDEKRLVFEVESHLGLTS